MRFPKFSFSLWFALFLAQPLFAQSNLSEGYYIDLKHDTIKGFFDLDDLYVNRIVFYASKTTTDAKTLLPNNITYIETVDKTMIRAFDYTYNDQKEPLFITKLTDGDIELYRGLSAKSPEKEVFFIRSTKIPEVRKITQSNPKAFLNTYFKGCELNANYDVRYTQNGLFKAVNQINACLYPEKEIVKKVKKTRPIDAAFGFKGGAFINNSKTEYLFGEREMKPTTKPILGITIALGLANSVKLYTGFNYFKRQLITSKPIGYTGQPFTFSTSNIEIPIEIHFELSKNKPRYMPEIIGGMAALIPSNPSTNGVYGTTNFYTASHIHASYFVGGGIKKNNKDKSSLGLYLRLASDNENPVSGGHIFSKRFELSLTYLVPKK
jgi:hypothetical protein